MFNAARTNGLALFVREGYRTQEEQQEIMDEKIMSYMEEGYSKRKQETLQRNMLQNQVRVSIN